MFCSQCLVTMVKVGETESNDILKCDRCGKVCYE